MKTKNEVTKQKNIVARAAAVVARKEIELRIASDVLAKAKEVLEKVLQGKPDNAQKETGTCLYILSAGANKIGVNKAIREVTSLGLKEAKDLVDSACGKICGGCFVGEFKDPETMKQARQHLHAAGATTTIA